MRRRVRQLYIDGALKAEHDSIKAAAHSLGINLTQHIIDVCRSKRKTAYGYKWEYIKESDQLPNQISFDIIEGQYGGHHDNEG